MGSITLPEIYEFCNSSPTTRNMVEGENVLNSGHIISCGYVTKDEKFLKICAMCLQTSAIRDKPHEIIGKLNIATNVKIIEMQCSCKAGTSQRCKHIVATLLKLNRCGISALEPISQTDRQCTWSEQKTALQKYAPKPLKEHTMFAQKFDIIYSMSEEQQQKINRLLLDRNKNSAISKHCVGRKTVSSEINNNILRQQFDIFFNKIKKIGENLMMINYSFAPLRECCQQVYDTLICSNLSDVCFESSISRYTWEKERKIRITGSRCYSLYTYSANKKPNWPIKAQKYFNSNYFSNKYVSHGVENEPKARKLYAATNPECTVFELGLFVSQDNPWLGYSADGLIFISGKPVKLLEIKCPYIGKTMGIKEVLKTCSYLLNENGEYCLKNRHSYFGQVQLGMYLFNLTSTDFCIYSSLEDSMFVINIKRDNDFIYKMLNTLKKVYFDHMLHVNCY